MPKIISKYYPPKYGSKAFNCLYCGVYADQTWENTFRLQTEKDSANQHPVGEYKPIKIGDNEVKISLCSHCKRPTFWWFNRSNAAQRMEPFMAKIMYPATRTSPSANDDLDDGIKKIYNEAADIANRSPRAACALLRLAIQMLLKQLGETGDNINNDIKNLVAKELDPKIQQALDIVRVTGNHAVHPGEIDFDDTTDVQALFDLINVIADTLITQPKQIEAMFNRLPQKDKESIKKRDKRTE